MTFAPSSSGRPTPASTCWAPPARRSSCTYAPRRSGDWHPPPSTGAVRRPKVHPSDARGLDCSELGALLFAAERFDHAHAALAVLLGLNGLRVSEACSADIENLGFERGHRTLRIVGKGNKPAVIPLVAPNGADHGLGHRRANRRPDPAAPRRPAHFDRRTAHRWGRSIAKRAGLGQVHPHMLRAGFIMCALDAGVPLRDVQIAARHADPRTTTVYDHRRQNFDKHAAYVVVAFVAGGWRACGQRQPRSVGSADSLFQPAGAADTGRGRTTCELRGWSKTGAVRAHVRGATASPAAAAGLVGPGLASSSSSP